MTNLIIGIRPDNTTTLGVNGSNGFTPERQIRMPHSKCPAAYGTISVCSGDSQCEHASTCSALIDALSLHAGATVLAMPIEQ